MKNLKIIAFVLFSICISAKTHSQSNFSIHLGPSFPVSDLASDDADDEDAGGAAVGLNVGVQYIYPITEFGLGIFGGIDFNYNGIKKDVKDDILELYESIGIYNPDIKYFKYINVPVTAGLNYTYQADDKIGVFANAGLAINLLKITDMELKVDGLTITTELNMAFSVGFKVGGGVLIGQKFSVSVDYLGLGKHDIEGEVKAGGSYEEFDGEQKVDLLTLTFGYKF